MSKGWNLADDVAPPAVRYPHVASVEGHAAGGPAYRIQSTLEVGPSKLRLGGALDFSRK